MFVYTPGSTHTQIFLPSQLRGPRSNDISVATSTPRTQILFLIPFSNKTNQGFLRKWLILGVKHKIYKTWNVKKKKSATHMRTHTKRGMLLLLLLLSRFSHVWLCATPKTAAHQALPSLGFSRQAHWSGLPFPSPMHESEKWKGSRSVVPDS